MKYKPKPRFVSGFIMPDGQPSNQTLVGSLFPQPYVETKENQKVLLDETLGEGFSLVARTSQPELVFAPFTRSIESRFQARCIAILPAGTNWYVSSKVTVVRELHHSLSTMLARYTDHLILLRPDHYVAASIPLSDIAHRSDLSDTLMQKTWIANSHWKNG